MCFSFIIVVLVTQTCAWDKIAYIRVEIQVNTVEILMWSVDNINNTFLVLKLYSYVRSHH
jgi:hypothetical protein